PTSRDSLDGFMRRCRSSHDRPPLARPACHQRHGGVHRPATRRPGCLRVANTALAQAQSPQAPCSSAGRDPMKATESNLTGPSARSAGTLLTIDDAVFQENFGLRPFRIEHNLVDSPLFSLPRLVELAKTLPAHRVEYNAGDIPVNVAPEDTRKTGLPIDETIR